MNPTKGKTMIAGLDERPLVPIPELARAKVRGYAARATSYCLRGRMADGSYTRPGSAASNRHPLGTRLRLLAGRGPSGERRFVVRDRIGWGSELDLWAPTCSASLSFGRKSLRYEVAR